MVFGDTTASAAAEQISIYRRMSNQARVELAARMSEESREVTLAGIRARHPEYSEAQAHDALLRILLGDELFLRVWPDKVLLAP